MFRTLLCTALLATAAGAQSAFEEAVLTASDAGFEDHLGWTVAIDDGTLITSAPGHASGGAVYAYESLGTSWFQTAKLNGLRPDAIALSGDTAAFCDGWLQGVHVYGRAAGSWTEEAVLLPGSGPSRVYSVALDGDVLAFVGLYAVEIYRRDGTTWGYEDEIAWPVSTPISQVALAGDVLVFGAPFISGTGSAQVYVHSAGQWSFDGLLAGNLTNDGQFGAAVDTDGTTIAVGATMDCETPGIGCTPVGAVYLFTQVAGAWTLEQRLPASDPQYESLFGAVVSLQADTLAVGAPDRDTEANQQTGGVYLFQRSGTSWSEIALLESPAQGPNDSYGTAVSLDGYRLAAGIPFHDPPTKPKDSGAVHVNLVPTLPAAAISYCTAGTSFKGCQVQVRVYGVASASADSGFLAVAAEAEANTGLMFFGTSGRQAAPWGNGTSFQCVVPPVRRGGLLFAGGAGPTTCASVYFQDLNARWCPTCPKSTQNPGAGAVTQLQFWYRDPANTSNQTTSFSDAVEFVVAP